LPRVVRRPGAHHQAHGVTRALFALTALAAAWLLAATVATQTPSSFRILISNDDGVRAAGLPVLAQALKPFGEVMIVAPSNDQSGVSQALTAAKPIFREDVMLPGGLRAIGLSATPATVMQIAIKNIAMPKPDLVVTGINTAYNLGYSAYLSGTVGAARQAVLEGVPAIAASMAAPAVPRDVAAAAQQVAGLVKQAQAHRFPPQTFLNVNIPPMPPGGYKGYEVTTQAATRAGTETFTETKRPGTNRTIYWSVYSEGASAADGTDIWAVNNGYVSVTPMHVGEFDAGLAADLRSWLK
jgi:5'/3'-nucleotidase